MSYLDDMDVSSGDIVECKENISAPWFTVGHFYSVWEDKQLIDDNGNKGIPSARFKFHKRREDYVD